MRTERQIRPSRSMSLDGEGPRTSASRQHLDYRVPIGTRIQGAWSECPVPHLCMVAVADAGSAGASRLDHCSSRQRKLNSSAAIAAF